MTIRRGNTIVAGIASTVVLDNVTTSMNANDAVQSIGTINKNGSSSDIAVYNWVGTLAQYTAQQIETQHPDWICYITDDGEASVSPWCLFDFKYTDYVLSNPNWVNADANEWCTSTNYPNAYAHLVADLTGISSSTETIGSYTITFYRATDGHKICLADQAQTIDNIFAETGVAWYYLVDTANTRFKLPRNKFGFVGIRNIVSDFVNESLPNISGDLAISRTMAPDGTGVPISTGAFQATSYSTNATGTGSSSNNVYKYDFNASRSSSTYQDNAPVQQKAVQVYLEFYLN